MAWESKANLRGPAGYMATGAAEDDLAISKLIEETAGPTETGAALDRKNALLLHDPGSTFGTELSAMLRRGVSVTDPRFGAKADGVTDDTAAIQAAIDYVDGGGGGIVFFPAGNYLITAIISVDNHSTFLVGEGAESILKAGGTARLNMFVFRIPAGRGFYGGIRDLRLYCQGIITDPIFVDSWHDWSASHVVASDYTGHMFDITSDQSLYTEFIKMDYCDSVRGPADIKPKGFAKVRCGSTGTVSEAWITKCSVFSLLGWGVELVDVQRCGVDHFVAANNADPFSGAVIVRGQNIAAFVPTESGFHDIDNIYMENLGGSAEAVVIESAATATKNTRGTNVRAVSVSPESLRMFRVTNLSATANLPRNNTFSDPRRPVVSTAQIQIGASTIFTTVNVPGYDAVKLAAGISDSGLYTVVNGTRSAAYGNGVKPSTSFLDVGQTVVNTSDNTVWLVDKAGALRLIGATLPHRVDVVAYTAAVAQSSFNTVTQDAFWLGGGVNSTGVVNAYREFDVVIDAGTWTLSLMHRRATDRGIYTVTVDGVNVGTIDGYATAADNIITQVAAITVATPGRHRIRFAMASKNASSSSYVGHLSGFTLFRTGA